MLWLASLHCPSHQHRDHPWRGVAETGKHVGGVGEGFSGFLGGSSHYRWWYSCGNRRGWSDIGVSLILFWWVDLRNLQRSSKKNIWYFTKVFQIWFDEIAWFLLGRLARGPWKKTFQIHYVDRSIDGCCIWFYFIALLFIPHHCGRTCEVIKKQHATIICTFYFISLKLGNDPFNFSMITPILSILKARNVSESQEFMPRSDQELRRKTVWDSAECGGHLWWRASQTLKVRTSKHGQFDSLIICIVNL